MLPEVTEYPGTYTGDRSSGTKTTDEPLMATGWL
jgi:hypothetical protein